jgi:hypothetical protein
MSNQDGLKRRQRRKKQKRKKEEEKREEEKGQNRQPARPVARRRVGV